MANALWSAATRIAVPEFPVGSIAFGASPEAAPGTAAGSVAGEAVSVVLPGNRLAQLLDSPEDAGGPVIWRFTATGSALGITGLDYSVDVREQRYAGESHDLGSGVAQPNTVLSKSTMKVYRAGLGGDCSAIPGLPEDASEGRNVYVYAGEDVTLQNAGAGVVGTVTEHEWCVAVEWNDEGDGRYRNDVHVTAFGEDGSENTALDRWHAVVGAPPALDMSGTYRSFADAEGVGEDGSSARNRDRWEADLYPDGSREPDVVISLQPFVTNTNPAFDRRP